MIATDTASGSTPTVIVSGTNDILKYDIIQTDQTTQTPQTHTVNATIPAGSYDDSSDLGAAVQTAINQASYGLGLPQYAIPVVTAQDAVNAGVGTVDFALVPEPGAPYVEMENVEGTAVTSTPAPLTVQTGSSTNDGLLESYDGNLIPACEFLNLSVPMEDPDDDEMTVSALLPGTDGTASGTITFSYFQQPDAPTDCTTGTTVVPSDPVAGDGTYTANFTPTAGDLLVVRLLRRPFGQYDQQPVR